MCSSDLPITTTWAGAGRPGKARWIWPRVCTTGSLAGRSARAKQAALSQILVYRDCEASFPLLVWPLRGQGVELFGRTATRLTAPFELPLAEHMHELNAGEGGLRRVKRFKP